VHEALGKQVLDLSGRSDTLLQKPFLILVSVYEVCLSVLTYTVQHRVDCSKTEALEAHGVSAPTIVRGSRDHGWDYRLRHHPSANWWRQQARNKFKLLEQRVLMFSLRDLYYEPLTHLPSLPEHNTVGAGCRERKRELDRLLTVCVGR
jgi:hypothetical protein